eukprot:9939802-Alexandrium_andersonii.AAC.1
MPRQDVESTGVASHRPGAHGQVVVPTVRPDAQVARTHWRREAIGDAGVLVAVATEELVDRRPRVAQVEGVVRVDRRVTSTSLGRVDHLLTIAGLHRLLRDLQPEAVECEGLVLDAAVEGAADRHGDLACSVRDLEVRVPVALLPVVVLETAQRAVVEVPPKASAVADPGLPEEVDAIDLDGGDLPPVPRTEAPVPQRNYERSVPRQVSKGLPHLSPAEPPVHSAVAAAREVPARPLVRREPADLVHHEQRGIPNQRGHHLQPEPAEREGLVIQAGVVDIGSQRDGDRIVGVDTRVRDVLGKLSTQSKHGSTGTEHMSLVVVKATQKRQ